MIESKPNLGEIIQLPPRIFTVSAKNIFDIERINSLEYLTVNLKPVQNRNFKISLKGTSFGSITQWYTDCPFGFISSPKLRLDKVTIRFVSEGAMRRRNSRGEYLASAGNAMLVKFEEMVTEEASSGFKGFAGTLDWSNLLNAHVALEGTDEIGFPELDSVVEGPWCSDHNVNGLLSLMPALCGNGIAANGFRPCAGQQSIEDVAADGDFRLLYCK